MTRDEKIVYCCGVDWQHEIGHASDGNWIFPSIQSLKASRPCWKKCGIVRLRVQLMSWEEEQDL